MYPGTSAGYIVGYIVVMYHLHENEETGRIDISPDSSYNFVSFGTGSTKN